MTYDSSNTGDNWDDFVPTPPPGQVQAAPEQFSPQQYDAAPSGGKNSGGVAAAGMGLMARAGGLVIFGVIAVLGWIANQGTTDSSQLALGDCFNVPADDVEEFNRLDTEPCDGPHDAQIIAVIDMDSATGAYPSDFDPYWEEIWARCEGAVGAVQNINATPGDLELNFYAPTEAGWNANDHISLCFISSNTGLVESHIIAPIAGN